jgi:hypothetical protein
VQVEGAVTGVDGDCQYVLFIVTVPPQVVTTSVRQVYVNYFTNSFSFEILYVNK